MDAISSLIRMARLEATLDVRCLLAGSHVLNNPPRGPGEAPFHVLLDGHCVVETGTSRVEMHAGDVLVLPRAHGHRVRVTGLRPTAPVEEYAGRSVTTVSSAAPPEVDLFCGHYSFGPGAGQLLFDGLPEVLYGSFGSEADSPLRLLGELMRQEAGADGPAAGALLASLCEALLALALRGAGDERAGVPRLTSPWTAVRDPGLRAVVDTVVQRPEEAWTITRLARVAGVSRATLVRRFPAATGMSVAEFLARIRMTVAADLLTTTERGLDDIAMSVGYRSPSAFGRTFRTLTGITPARLRRTTATIGR
ncbi:cupin domain-containing protein [Streptomyces graminifolii]|uniref:cupin domain-containing protein n=1 Tax=Streptomyces graminifolii TaxID=1266771 RepID=UPI004059A4F2